MVVKRLRLTAAIRIQASVHGLGEGERVRRSKDSSKRVQCTEAKLPSREGVARQRVAVGKFNCAV